MIKHDFCFNSFLLLLNSNANGFELLSAAAPRAVADIESLMATGNWQHTDRDTYTPWLAYPNQVHS